MSKIKEINIKTTDESWWRLIVNDISAIRYETDETIANRILAETSVLAGRIWIGPDGKAYIDGQVYINTANIVAIEVVRESEE